MAYLFDTDAISEVLKKRPAAGYLAWLAEVPRGEQFTSAVSIGELFQGAFAARDPSRHLGNIERRVLPALSVLPFDLAVARCFGELRAGLAGRGDPLAEADVQIAATALCHDLELVTGNLGHFARVPGLRIQRILAQARAEDRTAGGGTPGTPPGTPKEPR